MSKKNPPAPAYRKHLPLAIGLAGFAAIFLVFNHLSGPSPAVLPPGEEEVSGPLVASSRPEPRPKLPPGNLPIGRAVGEKPQKRQVTNEQVFKGMQEQAEALNMGEIVPVEKTRPIRRGYEALQATAVQPGDRGEILAYMRRNRAMQETWRRTQRESVPVSGRTTVLLGSPQPVSSTGFTDRTDWSGAFSGFNPAGNRTISDRSEWLRLWGGLSTKPTPEIDFARSQIVAVFLGRKPSGGYQVEIVGVSATESFIAVSYRVTKPPPGITPPEGATSPFALRVLPRSVLPVRFIKTK